MATVTPLLRNNVASTVQAGSSAIGSATATGINVATGDGALFGTIGTNQYVPAVIVDTSTNPETVKEYVYVTAVATDALTVVRQAEDPTTYAASTTTIAAGYKIVAVATRNSLEAIPPPGFAPAFHGFVGWAYDPILVSGAHVASANGKAIVTAIPVPADIIVNNVVSFVQVAGSALTASQCFAALYDASGTRLGVSTDRSAVWNSTGLKTDSIGTNIAVAGGPGVVVYAYLLANWTTSGPSFADVNGITAVMTNPNLGTSTFRAGLDNTARTATPSPLTLTGVGQSQHTTWVALS